MQHFSEIGLCEPILKSLERLNITVPTPIQAKAIPEALKGLDVMATAQTGTGKTFAYLIPILEKIENDAHGQALILAPTRELAEQISKSIGLLQKQNSLALIIGGSSYFRQITALKRRPRFIVGTPGRILDLMQQRKLQLEHIQYFVLDEMDRMLDMGFAEDLEKISKSMPTKRQTLMFSATLPPAIGKYAMKYLKDPVQITIGSTTQAASEIKQSVKKLSSGEKFSTLLEELENREGSVIIFVRTKISADNLAEKLNKKEHTAEALHGDLNQRKRERVIRSYRSGQSRILVATDIAARGIDIPHIKHVINYDLPQTPDDYIHRIGRTGRAGMEGFALSFVLPGEEGKWKAIHRLMSGQKADPKDSQAPQRRRFGKNKPWERDGKGRRNEQRGERGSRFEKEGKRGEWERKPRSADGKRDEYRKPKSQDGKRGEWERKPRSQDGKRAEWDPKPRSQDGKRAEWDRKPRSAEGKRTDFDRKPPRSSEGNRGDWERKPRSAEGKRSDFERKPRSSEGKQADWERKPRSAEGKRSDFERKPRSSEGKRADWERKPRSAEGKRSDFERKPRSAEGKRTERSDKPKSRDAKPTALKKRRTFVNPKRAKEKTD